MNNKFIYDNYRRQLINLHGLTIFIVAVAEITAYLLLLKRESFSFSLYSSYLWLKVVLPIFINLLGYAIALTINKYNMFKFETKNSLILNISLATAASISIFHHEFIASFSAFVFPIFLSGLFNYKKHLNKSFVVSLILMTVHLLIKAKQQTELEALINYIAFFGIIIVAYLFGRISIEFYDLNLFIIQNQSATNDRLRKKIMLDSLTGIHNREMLIAEIEHSIEAYKNNSIPFCLAIIDIDNFKMINDTYGHNKGDAILKNTAKFLIKFCESNDCVCRFGGDEFAVILNNKTLDEASLILDTITSKYANLSYAFTDKKITNSCGIAEYCKNMSKIELFNKADKNMYIAKSKGRNQIYCNQY